MAAASRFYDRCITRGVLGSIMPVIYGNGNMIFQAPGYVIDYLRDGARHALIPLDGRPHVGKNIRQYLGDARGHWEGNTLVVETTNFLGNTTGVGGNGGGTGTSEALRLTERFTRAAPDVLNYEATVDDPKTYTRPWKLLLPLTANPGYQVLPYECHEGNLAIANILSAARSEDRAAEEAGRKASSRRHRRYGPAVSRPARRRLRKLKGRRNAESSPGEFGGAGGPKVVNSQRSPGLQTRTDQPSMIMERSARRSIND